MQEFNSPSGSSTFTYFQMETEINQAEMNKITSIYPRSPKSNALIHLKTLMSNAVYLLEKHLEKLDCTNPDNAATTGNRGNSHIIV